MRKYLGALLLALTAATAGAQNYSDEKANFSVEKNGGSTSSGSGSTITGGSCTNQFVVSLDTAGLPTCGSVVNATITANTITLGKIAVAGGNSKILCAGSAGSGATYSECTVGSGITITGTVIDAPASGAPANATYITQTANATLSNEQAIGALASGVLFGTTTTGVISSLAGAAGVTGNQSLQFDGTNYAFAPACADVTKWDCISTSFWQHGASAGAAIINGFNVTLSGASAGYVTTPALIPDANHPNILEMTTGTASTGGASLGMGNNGSSSSGNGLVLSGGEVVDWLVYLPVVSGGTNTTQLYVGFCNTIGNGVCTDGIFFKWDENANTNWAVDSVKSTVHSGPTNSNTDATAAAWHHLRIEANSNATSFAMKVDGVALNVSPITTQIPVNVVFPMVKYVASAGCAAATTCVVDVNTVYYAKPVTR